MTGAAHVPVMPRECVKALNPHKGGVYLDGTAGLGGHSELLLEGGGQVICLDRDADALNQCKARLGRFGDRVRFLHGNYREMDRLLSEAGAGLLDGILLDIGVSSMQLDTPGRGFSYRHDAPLDMRMDGSQSLTAEEVVNEWDARQLVRIFYDYGEERYAPQLARGIVAARPLKTTAELAETIIESMPARGRREAQHPARRVFQAIRIAVNGELDALEEGLPAALKRLKPGGRLAVISFHSLEDRITKRVFAEAAKGCVCPPSFPACACGKSPSVRIIGRWRPLQKESEENPRSASAVLRVAEKI
ncbi:MAG: 16S rRNA (cytosine(1402)-N(4))-methyltransferase RsmH [Oscillospiraceae bacterium]|jgi:16S rRNA (cytosine1402-N4)-methyltransferase|nr:16S rRNA (cytosine(1402)-N(4))-methyltransferase RsmH [Oscillospiraceae bacterium]